MSHERVERTGREETPPDPVEATVGSTEEANGSAEAPASSRIPLPGFLREQPEEVWFFARLAAYAFFIGTVYWFVSYEPAGTMLLYGFGLAAGFGTLILALGARAARRSDRTAGGPGAATAEVRSLLPDGPFGDERGRLPAPTAAPFGVGLGVALTALGLVFGPWLAIVGLALAVVALLEWGRAVSREYRAIDPVVAARPRRGARSIGGTSGAAAAHQPSSPADRP